MERNVPKVLSLARTAQVTSVLLTGKGEPFLNYPDVLHFTNLFREFPVEIQTNGIWLAKHGEFSSEQDDTTFQDLYASGLNVIAVSVDDIRCSHVQEIASSAHDYGMLVRVTFNVTNKLFPVGKMGSLKDLVLKCKEWGADQMTLRNITIPNHTGDTTQNEWIKNNVNPELYKHLIEELKYSATGSAFIEGEQKEKPESFLVRTLQYGSKVYDYQGISVSYSDYCIQDSSTNDDIRSLVFMEDGHVYCGWGSKASILF
jgi:hypothetical protein